MPILMFAYRPICRTVVGLNHRTVISREKRSLKTTSFCNKVLRLLVFGPIFILPEEKSIADKKSKLRIYIEKFRFPSEDPIYSK